ncbi:hypothetical protein [Larsenimonas suaedae]|uniref:Ribbon-helix-helix protein, CopG family n=1 Tax=Larsenimonas suaedae TaxID=1851019 RepID=A0ABU1H0R3_9GAMM|nr:hypothetical protein [Larsenimonas suaedae]MCM2973477.1 hypothetical protein [Larsenimonas suaedae]MDR5897347.1 hypothetical protein [Larsenimonas suaedae]
MEATQAPRTPREAYRPPLCGRRIGLELPVEADAEVAKLAEREHRSKTGMTRMLVLEALSARRSSATHASH